MSRDRGGGGLGLPHGPLFVEGLLDAASGASAPAESSAGQRDLRSPGERDLPHYRHVAREAAKALGVSRVGLWGLDDAGGVVCLTRFQRETLDQEDNRRYPDELGRSFRFLLERAAMVAMNDTRTSRGTAGALHEWLRREGIRSLLAVPVQLNGRLAGWLTFEEQEGPRAWDDRDRSRALRFAGHLGGILACWEPEDEAEPSGNGRQAGEAVADPTSPEEAPGDGAPEPGAGREASTTAAAVPSQGPRTGPQPSSRRGRRQVEGRVRSLPALEGAALLGGESAGELLHLLEIQSGYLALLDEVVQDDPDDRELVEEARAAGERVRDGLLTFLTSLREGIPGREPLDLTAFLGGISAGLSRLAGDGVRLRLAPASEILRVRGNPRLLERALSHLVRNARDASPSGAGIRIGWGRWKPPGGSEPEVARIVVEDQGRGIPAQDLPWVFEPFYSGGGRAREGGGPGGGTGGLGLSVVQAVVEGHGGWVDVRSRPGEGTQVALHLPMVVPAVREPDASSEDPAVDAGTTRAPRILVVEDEPMLARLLDRILTRSGFRVTVVEIPEDADQIWRGLDGDVDLVIVERVLTGERSGLALSAPWRRETPGLPIMILDRKAAPSESDDGEGPRTLEGHPLLTRPFQPADVVGAVRRALAEAAGGGGGEEDVGGGEEDVGGGEEDVGGGEEDVGGGAEEVGGGEEEVGGPRAGTEAEPDRERGRGEAGPGLPGLGGRPGGVILH